MLSADSPLYNTVVIYIIIIVLILLFKPKFMYCKINKKFKEFGLEDGKTLFSFPIVCISTGIILYMIFMIISIICNVLSLKN